MSLTQQARQTQQMQMAPQQMQSLEFLQAPVMALRALVRRELESNPLIEEVENPQVTSLDAPVDAPVDAAGGADDGTHGEGGGDFGGGGAGDGAAPGAEGEVPGSGQADESAEAGAAAEGDVPAAISSTDELSFGDTMPGSDWDDGTYGDQVESESPSEEAEERRNYFFNSLTREQTLQESLIAQLGDLDLDGEEAELAVYIVDSLDENGWLKDSVDDLRFQTGKDEFKVAAAIATVQELDPAGVGARDLRECMLLQIDRRKSTPAAMLARRIVADCFDLLQKRKHQLIARRLKCTPKEIEAALALIRTLDPHPGRSVGPSAAREIVPEVNVRWNAEHERFEVDAEEEVLPRIRLNREYEKMCDDPSLPQETRAFLREKRNAAKSLASSLDMRVRTIVRIAQIIVDNQQDFFTKGVEYLKPMTMATVASQLLNKDGNPMHETTVSRAVAEKYMRLPDGRMLPLKFFFSTGLHTIGGADVSNKAIQDRIKAIVAAEDRAHPLSDQAIADILNEKTDITIARRTVAKYRDILKILPSSMRKG